MCNKCKKAINFRHENGEQLEGGRNGGNAMKAKAAQKERRQVKNK